MPLPSVSGWFCFSAGKPNLVIRTHSTCFDSSIMLRAKSSRLSRSDSSHSNSAVLDSPKTRTFCSRGALTHSFPLVSSARPGRRLGAAGEPSRKAAGLSAWLVNASSQKAVSFSKEHTRKKCDFRHPLCKKFFGRRFAIHNCFRLSGFRRPIWNSGCGPGGWYLLNC